MKHATVCIIAILTKGKVHINSSMYFFGFVCEIRGSDVRVNVITHITIHKLHVV
jgi:hypothetical protein